MSMKVSFSINRIFIERKSAHLNSKNLDEQMQNNFEKYDVNEIET